MVNEPDPHPHQDACVDPLLKPVLSCRPYSESCGWVNQAVRHLEVDPFSLRWWIQDRLVWLAGVAVHINNGGAAGCIYSNSGGWRGCECGMIYDRTSLTPQPPSCLLARPVWEWTPIAMTNSCRNRGRYGYWRRACSLADFDAHKQTNLLLSVLHLPENIFSFCLSKPLQTVKGIFWGLIQSSSNSTWHNVDMPN